MTALSVVLTVVSGIARFYVVGAVAYLALYAYNAWQHGPAGRLNVILQPVPAMVFAAAVAAIALEVL